MACSGPKMRFTRISHSLLALMEAHHLVLHEGLELALRQNAVK